MRNQSPSLLKLIVQSLDPVLILAGVLLYALGGGLARYLGSPTDWGVYWLGQGCVTFLQLSSLYLRVSYDPASAILLDEEGSISDRRSLGEERRFLKRAALQIALTFLTIGAVFTVLLYVQGSLNLPALLLLGIAFFLAFFYAVPPLQFGQAGFGELSNSILAAGLAPALAFVFLAGDLHRVLVMLTFPVTALCLSMLLASTLPTYARDIKNGRKTFMIRIGWANGMVLHNLLILVAYLVLGLGAIFGLPWGVIWPALLSLPVALFQLWQMNQISNGARTRWNLLLLTSRTTFFLTTYLLTFSLWIG